MKPQRIQQRPPSTQATCLRYMGDFHGTPLICGEEMELTLYVNAISESCTVGHTAHMQDVRPENWTTWEWEWHW